MRKYPLCCPHPLHLHFGASGDQRAQGRSPHPSDAQNWGGRRAGPDPPPQLLLPAMGLQHWVCMKGGGGLGPSLQPQGCRRWGGGPVALHAPPKKQRQERGTYGETEGGPPRGEEWGRCSGFRSKHRILPKPVCTRPISSPPPHIPIALPPPHKHRREGGALSPPRSQWDEQSGGGVPGEGGGGGPEGNGAHSPQGFTSQRRQSTEPNPPHRDRVTATVTT